MSEGTNVKTVSKRESNLELFRIITMLLIVAHHYVVNSGLTNPGGVIYTNPMTIPSLFLLILGAWGKTGINCFVMITGYFMCCSKITAKKYLKLIGEVWFYNIVIGMIFTITGYQSLSVNSIIDMLIPVREISDGFTSAFLVFYLFIPFLNILVHNMKEKQHLLLLTLCGFMYVILGTIHQVTMNYVSWFMVIYLIAAYIRLYPKEIFSKTRLWGGMTALCLLVSICSVGACAWLSMKLGKEMAYYFMSDANTFLAVVTGTCSFLFFKNLKIPYSPVINTFGASTFGVLLIHANSSAMRQWLWSDVLKNVSMYGKGTMYIHAIASVVGIFLVCSLIDMARIRLVEKPCLAFLDKHLDK